MKTEGEAKYLLFLLLLMPDIQDSGLRDNKQTEKENFLLENLLAFD